MSFWPLPGRWATEGAIVGKYSAFERLAAGDRVPYRIEVVQVKVAVGAKGVGFAGRCGESHPQVKHGDDVVAAARALRAAGLTLAAIGEQLGGIPQSTVWGWTTNRRRGPRACRIVSIRRKVLLDGK